MKPRIDRKDVEKIEKEIMKNELRCELKWN